MTSGSEEEVVEQHRPLVRLPADGGYRDTEAKQREVTRSLPSCQGGADPAQVQALLGHASIDTAARYFRSGSAENAAVIERIFDH